MSDPFVERLFAGIPEEILELRPHIAEIEAFNRRHAAERAVTLKSRVLAAEASVELAKFELEVARGVAALDLADLSRRLDDE